MTKTIQESVREESFKEVLEDSLDEFFPKGECKERGAALMLFARAIVEHKRIVSLVQSDTLARVKERVSLMKRKGFVETGRYSEVQQEIAWYNDAIVDVLDSLKELGGEKSLHDENGHAILSTGELTWDPKCYHCSAPKI